MADTFVELAPLKILPIPLDLPHYDLLMVWHPRYERDQAHMWLRERVRATLQARANDH